MIMTTVLFATIIGVVLLISVVAIVWTIVAIGLKNAKSKDEPSSLMFERLDSIDKRLAAIEKTLTDIP
jgi:hypothetical protein